MTKEKKKNQWHRGAEKWGEEKGGVCVWGGVCERVKEGDNGLQM